MASKRLKIGQQVRWNSQAGGVVTSKTGTIIASCRPWDFDVSQKTKIQILREAHPELSVDTARLKAKFEEVDNILRKKYRLKFDAASAYNREEEHYLVAVEAEADKPHLYHPRTHDLIPMP